MFKLFLYIVIAYLAYKIFISPKKLNPPGNGDQTKQDSRDNNVNYTDYEEIN